MAGFEPLDASDLAAEFEAGMAEHRAEVDAVATGPWPPTFEDTIVALERAGRRLKRVELRFEDAVYAHSTSAIRTLDTDVRPRLAAHRDAVALDEGVVRRIADLAERRDALGLDEEQACVLERYHRDAVRAGALLGGEQRRRCGAINERLAELGATFTNHLHEEMTALAVRVADPAELAGLPDTLVAAGAEAADGDGYLLRLDLPAVHPALEHLRDRDVRERLYRAGVTKARRGNEHDNRAVVAEIAALRAEQAALLGYESFAAYAVADETIGTVADVEALLDRLGTAAVAKAGAESERHAAALSGDGFAGPLQPWDWQFYEARERRERHGIDTGRLRTHFTLDRTVHDGLFHVAEQLYGLRFHPREDLAGGHPDVRVWAVTDDTGAERGLLYLDPFEREGKSGGAWMGTYADPAPLLDQRPVVVVCLNVTPPAADEPGLLTPLDVRMAFHEFGHALHVLLSDVAHPRVSGYNVAFDCMEFPSLFHESLWSHPEVLPRYARHHATGAPLTDAEAAALRATERDGDAAMGVHLAATSRVDLAWHTRPAGERVSDADGFEDEVVERHALTVPGLGPFMRSSFFMHIFGAEYAGRLYAYEWSACLAAIVREWLDEQGGLTRAAGARLREEFLSRGAVVDPLAAMERITGRRPTAEPLLRQRGLLD